MEDRRGVSKSSIMVRMFGAPEARMAAASCDLKKKSTPSLE